MISKKDITKFAKNIFKHQRGIRDHQIIHPQREWLLGLFFSLLILGGAGVWSAVTYEEVTNQSLQESTAVDGTPTIYREVMVQTALQEFSERKSFFESFEPQANTQPEPVVEDIEVATSTSETTSDVEQEILPIATSTNDVELETPDVL